MIPDLTEEELKDLMDVIVDCANSKTRIASERSLISTSVKDICKKLNLDKSIINKMINTYYKNNFDDEVALQNGFEELYTKVVK